MTKNKRRRPEARPNELLDAALSVFTEKGFAAARMEDVAERAGLSKGAVYLYFPSKDALFVALVRRFAETAVATVAAQVGEARKEGPEAALRRTVHLVIAAASDPHISAAPRLVLAEAARFPEIATLYRREVVDIGRRTIGAIIEEGCRQGIFRAVNPEIAIRVIMGPFVAHMMLTHVLVDDGSVPKLDADVIADGLLDIMLNGLKAQPGGAEP